MSSTGVINRLGYNKILNWNFIEFIEINDEKTEANIYFSSGNHQCINDATKVRCLVDLLSVFPDIIDNNTRKELKKGIKGSRPLPDEPNKYTQNMVNSQIKTDIPNIPNIPQPSSPPLVKRQKPQGRKAFADQLKID